MKDKGKYYTQQAMANRLGISRTTFSQMLTGNREIYNFEVEKIAADLKVSVSRVLQGDIANEVVRIEGILKEMSGLNEALEIADRLYSVSVGITERCYALNYVGRVHYELKNYHAAHSSWLEAKLIAGEIEKQFGDSALMQTICKNLMLSYTCMGEYDQAANLVPVVERAFTDDSQGMGSLCYTLAMIAYQRKDFVKAKNHLLQSYRHYSATDDPKEIGKAEHNLGYIEYRLGNYTDAKQWYERAMLSFKKHPSMRLIPTKDYVKALLKEGEHEQAEFTINGCSNDIREYASPDLEAKFELLRSIATGSMNHAIKVLSMDEVNSTLKLITCRYLQTYYSRQDDASSLLHYYKIGEGLSLNKSDVLDEEAL